MILAMPTASDISEMIVGLPRVYALMFRWLDKCCGHERYAVLSPWGYCEILQNMWWILWDNISIKAQKLDMVYGMKSCGFLSEFPPAIDIKCSNLLLMSEVVTLEEIRHNIDARTLFFCRSGRNSWNLWELNIIWS